MLIHLKKIIFPFLFCIALIIFSYNPLLVEKYYTYGIYNNGIAPFFRLILGWLPISLGDVIYIALFAYLIYKIFKFFKHKQWKFNKQQFIKNIVQLIYTCLWVYSLFLLLWGLNYSRPGVAQQLQITPQAYSTDNIVTMVQYHDSLLKTLDTTILNNEANLSFEACKQKIDGAYKKLSANYNFINYKNESFKKSLLSGLGNYMGFFGYLNPFTNEAQINTNTPSFLLPFVSMHEVAHQLGYASESEANLIGYMACMHSEQQPQIAAACFEVLLYGYAELSRRDTTLQRALIKNTSPWFIKNYKNLQSYRNKYSGKVDKATRWLYDLYLKGNKQSSGATSYSELTSWLIAYKNKNGIYP
jgi:hypothetical protein